MTAVGSSVLRKIVAKRKSGVLELRVQFSRVVRCDNGSMIHECVETG
jgi:hypothetical protein